MKTNELRVGNIVSCELVCDLYTDRKPYYGKNIYSVSSIFRRTTSVDIGHDLWQTSDMDNFKPIPLTEEWLARFGFVSDDYFGRVLYCNGYLSNIRFYNGECVMRVRGSNDVRLPKIEYVHQLQNLYFALTGEELTIKDTAV
jgi:hypothetical protein